MIIGCSKCGKKLKVAESLRGKKVKCPCGTVLNIPDANSASATKKNAAPSPATKDEPVDLGDLSNIPPPSPMPTPQFSGGYNPYSQPKPAQPSEKQESNGSDQAGLAITSMILGILAWVTCGCHIGLLSLLAIIFGHVALSKVNNGTGGGKGFAIAGLATGYSALLPSLVVILYIAFYGIAALFLLFGAMAAS